MSFDLRRALHRPLLSRAAPLDKENAASRISAYIYGNILILAALIPLTTSQDSSAAGMVVVIGVALSTFVAHAFAESVGRSVRSGKALSPAERVAELRDSVPIVSAAILPVMLLAIGWWGWLDPTVGRIAAELTVIARIASTNFVIARLRGEKPARGTLVGSLVLAGVALVVVAIKLILTH